MEKMGFHEKWIQLIMKCISTVSYSVIINGAVHGSIFPTRGLRQGDLLSPFLFLLCADGLSSLINEAVRSQGLSGISICRGCPLVSHLFFADDSLLFCKASEHDCRKLIEILQLYEAASGQKFNAKKSSVIFSHNTLEESRRMVLDILGPMQDTRLGKFLGLPSIIGRSKTEVLQKLRKRWEEN